MAWVRVLGIALLILGILACIYGGFSYTKDSTAARLGPIELEVEKKERVNVPLWAGVVTAAVGALLLLRRE